MHAGVRRLFAAGAAVAILAGLVRPAKAWDNPKARPPRAKPHRRTGGQGMPPLPLPATPLRRTERKRQPAPPALVGLVVFSPERFRIVDGQRRRVEAFPTTHIDIGPLMRYANQKLDIHFRYVTTTLDRFSWDPRELPLLYVTGWTAMPALSDESVARLRRYLYDGGTLVLHAQCGRPEFIDSARKQIARLLPDRPLGPLDSDSPVFGAYFKKDKVRVRKNAEPFQVMPPYLEAVYLGCRPAVILSPVDLNVGWDVVHNPIQGGILYHQQDGLELGINVITTVLANFQYARAWGVEKVYPQQDKTARDQLVIAQIVHNGDWDPTPHALPNLMKHIQKDTTLHVQFKRRRVDPADDDVFQYPVLYLTGLRDFRFSKQQVAQLRRYLTGGGVLVADAATGKKAFDVAFRREIRRILPDGKLKEIEADSPLYQMPYKIAAVGYTPMVKAARPGLDRPTLEGISLDGQWCVVYSRYSLSNGWERLGFAYNRGYGDQDALRLGVNIIAYALTH